MFKKILIPVDLSEPDMATPALAEAQTLAKASGGELRLINVQSLLPATFMDYVPAGFDDEQRGRAAHRSHPPARPPAAPRSSSRHRGGG